MSDRKLCLNGCFRILPASEFGRRPRSLDGLASRCLSCEADRAMVAKHGMTKRHKGLLAADQGGCAGCGCEEAGSKGWVVDHDRSCCSGDKSCADCRRGVLCQSCNSALGYAKDNPRTLRRLADYIEAGTRMGNFKSELELEMPTPPVNTDGRTGRTNEDGGYDCESSFGLYRASRTSE